jgi:uncharacterized Zn-finger protein
MSTDKAPSAGTGARTTDEPADGAPVAVRAADLPVFCPNPGMPLWSSHPRVYLELDAAGETRCPYCGTRYRLDGPRAAGH